MYPAAAVRLAIGTARNPSRLRYKGTVAVRHRRLTVLMMGIFLLTGVAEVPITPLAPTDGPLRAVGLATACAINSGPEYYAIELVGTNRIPGSGLAHARAEVSVPAASPFVVSLTTDGSYQYDVHVSIARMKNPRRGVLVAWVTTSTLDEVRRIGALDQHFQAVGTASWNKFLVVVTLEDTDDPSAERWTGPVVFRGMSRSGMMHTMVGHGALQQENCAAYGYDD